MIIIIIDTVCTAQFSIGNELTALYTFIQHLSTTILKETNRSLSTKGKKKTLKRLLSALSSTSLSLCSATETFRTRVTGDRTEKKSSCLRI